MQKERLIKEKLLEVLETTPYNKIKVRDFADYAGISRSTFYFYFNSIDEAISDIEDQCIGRLPDAKALATSLAVKVPKCSYAPADAVISLNKRMSKQLNVFRVLSGPNGRPQFQQKLYDRLLEINTMYYGVSKVSEKYLELTTEFFSGAQWYLYRWWANHADEVTCEEMTGYLLEIFKTITYHGKP